MFELYLKGKVENVVRGKDFTNKETGEVKKGSVKLQFIGLDEVKGLQTIDVSVPEEFENKAFELKGKEVQLPVSVFARNSKIYYRVKEL
jgi:hypothetical protein